MTRGRIIQALLLLELCWQKRKIFQNGEIINVETDKDPESNRKVNGTKTETLKYKCHHCRKVDHKSADCEKNVKKSSSVNKSSSMNKADAKKDSNL